MMDVSIGTRDAAGCVTRGLLIMVVASLLFACSGTQPAADPDPNAQYQAAITDARTAEPSEITTTLTPLVPYNDSLVWRNRTDSTRQVLVATWGGSNTLPSATAGDTVTADEDIWVTVVPAVKQFCRTADQTGDDLQLRLAQRLGLPPNVDYERFVELWVQPQDLVRPCPDPEVTDHECELRPPKPATHVQVSDAHQAWFQKLKDTSYGPDGYPFTGLGYTYDWNPTTDEVGPSEFVLRPGESGVVRATYSTAAYCRSVE